ncbi:PAS-domain containing protein [Pararhodobacter oceanensis]|nr:PAS-domain containing protein [Pararhodobacter oceanensis]
MLSTLLLALVLTGTSALTVAAVLLITAALPRKNRRSRRAPALGGGDAAFLFAGEELIDTNDAGAALLTVLSAASGGRVQSDWQRLLTHLDADFPDLGSKLAQVAADHRVKLLPDTTPDTTPGPSSALELEVERRGDTLRLRLIDTQAEGGMIALDRLSYRALQAELALLRGLIDSAPFMLWRENSDGQVIWANSAYLLRLAAQTEISTWPLPNLFPQGEIGDPQRLALVDPATQGRNLWFDVNRTSDPAGRLGFAVPADEAQRAERVKQEFVQTLTKTFATLPTGLAVFDRTRRLQIFNPALIDLTGLEVEFLLSRPGLEGFLNRMRDKRVLPEPRDYHAWSRRLLDIESYSPQAEFDETWTLPDGQTFRVSANPHPDGALAFLIEDITSETRITRHVRAEMETSQAVLNQIDAAIAVFAPNGHLVLTNRVFSLLWPAADEDLLTAVTLPEALKIWSAAGTDTQLWQRIGALARRPAADALPITGEMQLPDGEPLQIEARRMSSGALMLVFTGEHLRKTASRLAPETVSDAAKLRASA